jgi:ABC-type polysaccharide/polyol phosphate export permease
MSYLRKILTLTYYQMRSRYRKTLAGFIWVIANPIINFSVQALVFKLILKINIDQYPAFLLSGLLPWFFISQSVTALSGSLVGSRDLLLGFKISPMDIIASQVLDNFVNYIVAALFLIITLMTFGMVKISGLQVLLFFANSLVLLPFVFVVTGIVSFLHVFYRDVQFVTSFVMNIAFFLTPIFYTIHYVNPEYQWIFNLNIFYPIVALFQDSFHSLNLRAWAKDLLITSGIIITCSGILILLMKKKMKDFYINV